MKHYTDIQDILTLGIQFANSMQALQDNKIIMAISWHHSLWDRIKGDFHTWFSKRPKVLAPLWGILSIGTFNNYPNVILSHLMV